MNEVVRIVPAKDRVPRFTALDFERMIAVGAFADLRAELVAGKIEKMMPALPAHGERNITIAVALHTASAAANVRIMSDVSIRIDPETVRAADIAVAEADIAPDRIPAGDRIILAVGIADTTLARDLGGKRADYSRAGVRNYWVVDAEARVVHIMSAPTARGYANTGLARFGEPIGVPGTNETITIG